MSTLGTAAAIASICSVTVLPLGGLTIWAARNWIHREIVTKLSNDDTPVAKYAHDSRDYAKQSLDVALSIQQTLLEHIADRDLHGVH